MPTIRRQYERWPYPHVPLPAAVPSTHPWQLHCDWLWDRCGSGPAPRAPRLWIAGCGTFQPYVFALANPQAEIVATDLSAASLRIAARRCRLHRVRNVAFAPCDLTDPATWPEGRFDLIECYGVLMNLPDPTAALRALGQRLTPGGVLRLMVYPQFSRARIFQLQRLAHLCGFHAGEPSHPRRFRRLARSLDAEHPLRWAFTSYEDSRNDAGIVDGFLHAGDRGFTGLQLGALVQRAGLRPAHWFHKPWAQPGVMAERLRLGPTGQSFVLHYLDAWQELRGNFVVCLRRADAPHADGEGVLRVHPTFAPDHAPLRHRLRLTRLRWLGGSIPDRTSPAAIPLRPTTVHALARDGMGLDGAERARLAAHGLLLGGVRPQDTQPAHVELGDDLLAGPALRLGRRAPNPLYAHLFAAFELAQRRPDLGLPELALQAARWAPWAEPLERGRIRFGLTPWRTYQCFRAGIEQHLAADPLPAADGWAHVRLRRDADCLAAARAFAAAQGVPARSLTDAAARELWTLVFAYDRLFLPLAPD